MISQNIVIIVQKHVGIYGNIVEMNQVVKHQALNLLDLNRNSQVIPMMKVGKMQNSITFEIFRYFLENC